MASELHPLRFELQIWQWAPQQTHGASSLEIQIGNFAKAVTTVGPQNPDIQMRTFLTWDFLFFMLLFFSERNLNLLDIQEHCIRKLGKIQSELKLLFGVYY